MHVWRPRLLIILRMLSVIVLSFMLSHALHGALYATAWAEANLPMQTGSISGHVTSSLTGGPLANAEVLLFRSDDPTTEISFTLTDEAGNYLIEGVVPGSYLVSFNLREYAFAHEGKFYNDKGSAATADPVVVTAGSTITGINAFLLYQLNMTGRAVWRDRSEPVWLIQVRAYNEAGELKSYTRSDDKGYYSVTRLLPGTYYLRFGDDSFVGDEALAAPYFAEKISFADAEPITVISGETTLLPDVALVKRHPTDLQSQPFEVRVAAATTRPDVLLTTHEGGFAPRYTIDGGQSWSLIKSLSQLRFDGAPQLAVVPKDDPLQPVRFILAAAPYTAAAESGIYRSGDYGATWSKFVPPRAVSCDHRASTFSNLVASPADPQRLYIVVNCYGREISPGIGELVDVEYRDLFTSEDGGVAWQEVTMPTNSRFNLDYRDVFFPSPVLPQRLYARNSQNYYLSPDHTWVGRWQRSDNAGETWLDENFDLMALALDWDKAETLYGVHEISPNTVLTYPGYHYGTVFRFTGLRSINSGETWNEWAQQPCPDTFRRLVSLPVANGLLLLCDQGLYRSENGGDSWTKLSDESGEALYVHATGEAGQAHVLWLRNNELWGSQNLGTTWSPLDDWHGVRLPIAVHRLPAE